MVKCKGTEAPCCLKGLSWNTDDVFLLHGRVLEKVSQEEGRKAADDMHPWSILNQYIKKSTKAPTYCHKLGQITQEIKGTEMISPLVFNIFSCVWRRTILHKDAYMQ